MRVALFAAAFTALIAPAAAPQPVVSHLSDLLTLYGPAPGDRALKVTITTSELWQRKREDIRRRVLDIMGEFPAASVPLAARELSRVNAGPYLQVKVTYAAQDGETIPAWLLVPKGDGPFPAVLAAHPTNPAGKDSVIGLEGSGYRYAGELAVRGFVVLAPDSITGGERVLDGVRPYVTAPFDRAHPAWSAMGKMCADHRRGIDYLVSLPYVDPSRLGVIGHSLGGYNAFFLGAFDERVRATVSSCGFTPLAGASRPFAWSRENGFVHFPRLAPYLRGGLAPFDFHEVLALLAPRGLYSYSAARDVYFPDVEAVRAGAAQVAGVYRLLGAADQFVFRLEDTPHAFPEAVRQHVYDWLIHQLALRTQ